MSVISQPYRPARAVTEIAMVHSRAKGEELMLIFGMYYEG
jgi:hypothetical protein